MTEVYNANGYQYNDTTTFAPDGSASTKHTETNLSNGVVDASKTTTTAARRTDFSYILNQLPVARQMAGY